MRILRATLVAWALTLGPAFAMNAPVPPPKVPISLFDNDVPETKMPFARTFSFGRYKGHLGITKLKSIPAYFGRGKVTRIADVEPFDQVCYDLPASNSRVWLAIFDETGNGEVIDTISAEILPKGTPKTSQCPQLPDSYQPLVIDKQIQLGMSEKELILLLGKPTKNEGNWRAFHGYDRKPGLDDTIQRLFVKIDKGRVVSFEAENMTTD